MADYTDDARARPARRRSSTRRRTTSARRTSTRSTARPTRRCSAARSRRCSRSSRRRPARSSYRVRCAQEGHHHRRARASRCYADDIVWAFGHISQGMYTGDGKPQDVQPARRDPDRLPDRERRARRGTPKATAANGKDKGASRSTPTSSSPRATTLMKTVARHQGARRQRRAPRRWSREYVDWRQVVPHDVITERFLRFPKAELRLRGDDVTTERRRCTSGRRTACRPASRIPDRSRRPRRPATRPTACRGSPTGR